jgi:hypothetical protein
MYLGDVLTTMLGIEGQVVQFQKYASEWVYGNYLALATKAESSQLCAVSDAYNYSQLMRIFEGTKIL